MVHENEQIEKIESLESRERVISKPVNHDDDIVKVEKLEPLSHQNERLVDRHRMTLVHWMFITVIICVAPFFIEGLFIRGNEAHFAATMAVMRSTYLGMSPLVMTIIGAVFGYYFGSHRK